MNERIKEFLVAENKSSAQLADEIGVQPSGISHILSGRNNPSLDFVLKMLERYQFLSNDWLLFGKGTMYKEVQMQSLFEEPATHNQAFQDNAKDTVPLNPAQAINSDRIIIEKDASPALLGKTSTAVKKIVWFYDDNSFEEYHPGS